MLYVMTERWPPARKYRDVFERIKTNVTDVIAQGNHQATRAAGFLDADMTERCRTLDQGLPAAARTDYAQMISDMAKDRGRGASDGNSRNGGAGSLMEHGNGHHAHNGMGSGSMMEYGNGHGQGSFIDSGLMYNLENFGDVMTDWDLANIALLDNTNMNM
jgi:hypothetical protein